MDPLSSLSIATGAIGLAATATKLGKTIYDIIQAINTTDETLTSLASELNSLTESSAAVERGLNTPKLRETFEKAAAKAETEGHLASLGTTLTDCNNALKNLQLLLQVIQEGGSLAHGIMRKPAIAWKLNSHAPDLGRLKGQIQMYRNSMNVYLHLINLLISADSNSSIGKVYSQVSEIKTMLLNLSLQNRKLGDSGDFKPESEFEGEDPHLSQHMHDFISASEVIISTASEKFGSAAGSIGANLSVINENSESQMRTMAWVSDATFKTNQAEDLDNGGDFQRSFISQFGVMAREAFEQKKYTEAAVIFSRFISMAAKYDNWDPEEIYEAKMTLTTCYNLDKNYDLARKTLESIDTKKCSDPQALQVTQYLAEVAVLCADIKAAKAHAESAAKQSAILYTASSAAYHDAVSLLVDLLRKEGDLLGARVLTRGLPQAYKPSRIAGWVEADSDRSGNLLDSQEDHSIVFSEEETALQDLPMEFRQDLDKSKNEAFLWAAANNKVHSARYLIQKGANIETSNSEGSTVLILAANSGHEEIVKLLIESNAKLEARSPDDNTALTLASYRGHTAVARLLIESKANIEARNSDKSTALILASWEGHWKVVRLLIENNANIEASNSTDNTALILASFEGHRAAVKLLIESKANIEHRNCNTETALIAASIAGREAVVRLLIESKANIEASTNRGDSALSHASFRGYETIVRLLIESKADIEASNKYGSTALILASWEGQVGIVRLLIESKANVNAKNNDDNTALTSASNQGHEAVVRLLIQGQAIVDAKNLDGQTALTLASTQGYEAIVKLLIKNKANLEARNNYGYTGLISASWKGHEEIVKLLLKNKARVNESSNNGNTALMLASSSGHGSIVKLLVKNKADVEARNDQDKMAIDLAETDEIRQFFLSQKSSRLSRIQNLFG